ncbi:MAG: LamG domain-containing protein, partial [Anaerolineae bacterium]
TAPGTHTIEARAADRVGHLSDVDSVTFVVDAAAPLVAVDAAVTQQVLPAYQNGGAWTVDLSGSVIDPAPASGVTAVIIELLDEAGNAVGGRLPAQLANERWQIAYPFFTRPGGRYTIRVTAVDQVGHETVWANETIGADGTPPVIDISYTEPFSRANAAEPLPQVMAGVNPTPVIRGTVSDIATPGNRLFSFHFEVAAGAATFYDSSGLWQNAVCGQTACPTAASGRWGQGLRFDGSDDTLTIPEYTFVPTNYTMAAWFKTNAAVPQTILAAANPANDNPGALLQLGGDGRLHYIHRLPTGTSGGQDLVSPAAYDDGRWHHLAAVRNGVDLGLFVDGRIVVTGTTNLTATQGLSLTIGSLGNGGHFDGWLDEVMVYGRALSSEQIQAMANPAAAGVAGLEIRLRHLQDGDGTSLPWLPITLAQPGAAFSAWSYPLPAGLEGPYQLDLRATDSFGHVNTQLDAWVGEIDTLAPRVELRVGDTYHRGNTNLTSYQCLVTDYNLTDRGFSCPVDVTAVNQNAAWYTAWFSQTKVYQYASPYWTWLRDENGPYTLTACDLFDNCSTAVPTAPRLTTVAQSPLTIAIWTPAPQSVFTPTEPITLTGYAFALNNLSALTVTVNGVPISTTTWTSSITETVWSVVWTPPAEGVYTLAAAISDQTGGVSSSQIPAVVDVTPPELNVSTRNVNGRNYDDAGYVAISGQISDTVGVDRLQINLNGMGWQEAAVPNSAL